LFLQFQSGTVESRTNGRRNFVIFFNNQKGESYKTFWLIVIKCFWGSCYWSLSFCLLFLRMLFAAAVFVLSCHLCLSMCSHYCLVTYCAFVVIFVASPIPRCVGFLFLLFPVVDTLFVLYCFLSSLLLHSSFVVLGVMQFLFLCHFCFSLLLYSINSILPCCHSSSFVWLVLLAISEICYCCLLLLLSSATNLILTGLIVSYKAFCHCCFIVIVCWFVLVCWCCCPLLLLVLLFVGGVATAWWV